MTSVQNPSPSSPSEHDDDWWKTILREGGKALLTFLFWVAVAVAASYLGFRLGIG